MSYTKEFNWKDYSIVLDYSFSPHNSCLVINNWTAYDGDQEYQIPCVVTSGFIERHINEWLDAEWSHNGGNYVEDYRIHRIERRYDND